MHQHNEDLDPGLEDNSGVEIYYTGMLRRYDAGITTLYFNGMYNMRSYYISMRSYYIIMRSYCIEPLRQYDAGITTLYFHDMYSVQSYYISMRSYYIRMWSYYI